MEFNIDINTTCDGHVHILDLAKDFDQYASDDYTGNDKYKYDLSATLNVITKVTTKDMSLMDVLLNDHTSELDKSTFKLQEDGYYMVTHIVLPTVKWLEQQSNLDQYRAIYVTDGKKVYKVNGQNLEECTIKELIEINSEDTTLFKCVIDVVYTGNLQECYFNYCSQIFNSLLSKCAPTSHDASFARDFIWMTINIIDYLVCNKQYMEAQRIIETFNTCNGFCKQYTDKKKCCCCEQS